MSRMLELVRTSQLASHQMMSASKGALRLPAVEMVEILVYIAENNKIFRETCGFQSSWESVGVDRNQRVAHVDETHPKTLQS